MAHRLKIQLKVQFFICIGAIGVIAACVSAGLIRILAIDRTICCLPIAKKKFQLEKSLVVTIRGGCGS